VSRVPVAVVGSGNIGTDLVIKLRRSDVLEPVALIGIDPASDGLRHARKWGLETSADGADWLFANAARLGVRIAYEATSAAVHAATAPRYAAAGIVAIDLTPAAVGPAVVPPVNLERISAPRTSRLITCGGQATIPGGAVRATSRSVREIVSTWPPAPPGAAPGAPNIVEFTETTARVWFHGAPTRQGDHRAQPCGDRNPHAQTPLYSRLPRGGPRGGRGVGGAMAATVAAYVPGYRVKGITFDDGPFTTPGGAAAERVSVFLEVTGRGDYLPAYAGNLDIMTASAVRVGETLAQRRWPTSEAAA